MGPAARRGPAELRAAVDGAVTPAELRAVLRELLLLSGVGRPASTSAADGAVRVAAARLLLAYELGPPEPAGHPGGRGGGARPAAFHFHGPAVLSAGDLAAAVHRAEAARPSFEPIDEQAGDQAGPAADG